MKNVHRLALTSSVSAVDNFSSISKLLTNGIRDDVEFIIGNVGYGESEKIFFYNDLGSREDLAGSTINDIDLVLNRLDSSQASGVMTFDITSGVTSVPESTSLATLLAGMVVVAVAVKRRAPGSRPR